jgi:hypothetical protein
MTTDDEARLLAGVIADDDRDIWDVVAKEAAQRISREVSPLTAEMKHLVSNLSRGAIGNVVALRCDDSGKVVEVDGDKACFRRYQSGRWLRVRDEEKRL